MKRGQVWIETVIYTLVAFIMIGLVLAYAKPKIDEMKDKAIIEQSIGVLETIHSKILDVEQKGVGNKREIEVGISKGQIEINGESDQIVFEVDSAYTYSEPEKEISQGDVDIYTRKLGSLNKVNLTLNYTGKYNITYSGGDTIKTLTKASTPYKVFVSNSGISGGKTIINIEVE
jgi:hypothetical protein